MSRRTLLIVCVTTALSIPLVAACAVMSARVGNDARFVTWPVVAFTVLAGAVALVGVLAGLAHPVDLAVGIVPAVALSYFLPAAPLVIVAIVLMALGAGAVVARGVTSGVAASTGALMVLVVVSQGAAVECHDDGVSSNSGPWWVDDASSASGSGSGSGMADEHRFAGIVQVGEHHYRYACERSHLEQWDRDRSPR